VCEIVPWVLDPGIELYTLMAGRLRGDDEFSLTSRRALGTPVRLYCEGVDSCFFRNAQTEVSQFVVAMEIQAPGG
jgi:hypothetical protein